MVFILQYFFINYVDTLFNILFILLFTECFTMHEFKLIVTLVTLVTDFAIDNSDKHKNIDSVATNKLKTETLTPNYVDTETPYLVNTLDFVIRRETPYNSRFITPTIMYTSTKPPKTTTEKNSAIPKLCVITQLVTDPTTTTRDFNTTKLNTITLSVTTKMMKMMTMQKMMTMMKMR